MNWEISKYFATPNAIQNSDTFQLLDTMLKQLNMDHGATLRLGGGSMIEYWGGAKNTFSFSL